MKISKQGVVYRATEGPFRYQAWPSICIDENDTLYVACSGHRAAHICPFGKNLMFTSTDGGDTWSVPSIIEDTWYDDRDAGLTYLGDGKILLHYFHNDINNYLGPWRAQILSEVDPRYKSMTKGALEAWAGFPADMNGRGAFIKISEDYGKTWGKATKIPVQCPHGPQKTVSGRLLMIGKEWFSDGAPEDKGQIFVYESFDEGESFKKLSKIELPDGCNIQNVHEPHIIELKDGRIIAAIRGQDSPVYENFSIFFAESHDGGKTFTKPWATEICGSPPHLYLLDDGGVLCCYGRRKEPYGIRAVVSYDGCRSFGEEMILSEADDADLGYPATVQLSDGSFITVYYQRYCMEDGNKTSIMYTKWKF